MKSRTRTEEVRVPFAAERQTENERSEGGLRVSGSPGLHSFFESQLHMTRFTGSDQDMIKNVMAYVADGLPARWTGR